MDATELGPAARERLRVVETFRLLVETGVASRVAAKKLRVPRSTLYRWVRVWLRDGPRALEPRSRRPRRVRQPTCSAQLALRVEQLRRQYPWGKRKLAALLRREGHRVSESTVGRVLRQLMRRGVLAALPPCGAGRSAGRTPDPGSAPTPSGCRGGRRPLAPGSASRSTP